MFFREPMRLLPKEDLVKTGPFDCAAGLYKLHTGWLQKAGIRLGVDLLPNRVNRLLEIGYGSGVLMPELDTHTNQLYGIDPHALRHEVSERLRIHGVHPRLTTGTAEELPYENGYFDRIIAVGSMEYINDINTACREMIRVLAPGGRLVVVTAGMPATFGLGSQPPPGESQKAVLSAREKLIPTLLQHFEVVRWWKYPPLLGNAFCLYHALDLEPQSPVLTPHSQHSERKKMAV